MKLESFSNGSRFLIIKLSLAFNYPKAVADQGKLNLDCFIRTEERIEEQNRKCPVFRADKVNLKRLSISYYSANEPFIVTASKISRVVERDRLLVGDEKGSFIPFDEDKWTHKIR